MISYGGVTKWSLLIGCMRRDDTLKAVTTIRTVSPGVAPPVNSVPVPAPI
jgi:hypothetical protein